MCITARLPAQQCGETTYCQPDEFTLLSVTPFKPARCTLRRSRKFVRSYVQKTVKVREYVSFGLWVRGVGLCVGVWVCIGVVLNLSGRWGLESESGWWSYVMLFWAEVFGFQLKLGLGLISSFCHGRVGGDKTVLNVPKSKTSRGWPLENIFRDPPKTVSEGVI